MSAALTSWLRRRPHAPAARVRLAVEAMEDRTVPSSVSGVVFNDLNRSGVQDAGDGVFAGWTVYLDPNRNGVLDAGEPTTVTDAAGGYQFDTTNAPAWVSPTNGNLADFVTLDLPAGEGGRYMNTTATVLTVNRTTSPDTTGKNFGAYFQPFAGTGLQPVGTETLASETTAGAVSLAAVAADAAGNYTVAWKSTAADGTGSYVARVFNADGTPRTGQFVVATGIAANVAACEVAMSRDGTRVIVAWQDFSAANQSSSTLYRVYTGSGAGVTAGAVSLGGGTATTSVSLRGVAADTAGNAVILYKTNAYSKNWGWSTPTVKAQRVSASGAVTGSPITVASLSLINGEASVAMDGAGRFVVVYDESTGNSRSTGTAVFAQCYTASGAKAGGLITVASGSATAAGLVRDSSVAMNASGRFVVTYGTGGVLRARVFNFGGTPVGSVVDVATGPFGGGNQAAVAMDDDGNITFTWTDERDNSATPSGEVRIKRLSASGVLGEELIVDTTTQGEQSGSAVAATGAGTVVTVWVGYGLGDDSGVFMQQYGPA